MKPQRVTLRDHLAPPECLRDFGVRMQSRLESRWTRVGGLRLHSRSSASQNGARFLLIHGLVISSLYMIPLAECLAMEAEVHALDLPGFGRSEKPPEPLDVAGLAKFVAQWMAGQGGGAWHVVGNSFGCQVSAELAAEHPELMATLTLIGSTIDPAAPRLWRQALRLFRDARREPFRLWFNHFVDYARAGPRFAVALMQTMMKDRIETKLPRIEAPTLVMRGEFDYVAPPRWMNQMTALLPRGQFLEIPNGSHCVHYAAPDSVAEAIRDFIAATPEAGATNSRSLSSSSLR